MSSRQSIQNAVSWIRSDWQRDLASRESDATRGQLGPAGYGYPKSGKQAAPSSRLDAIHAQRHVIHQDFEQTARQGFVPGALIVRLYANHAEEVAEERGRLSMLNQGLEACIRRLDALFPEPAPAEPEPEAPPLLQHFPMLSSVFTQRRAARSGR